MVGKFALKNLSKCLDQEWEIPFDVSISVKSSEGKSVHIKAHKTILAMSSKVFKERDTKGYYYEIFLYSSHIIKCAENKCWENKGCGIIFVY